jgi:hypothetical protein
MEVVIPHTTIISTNNIEDIYTTDLNKTTLTLLKKRYVGRVFKGCFVTDIELIPNRMVALFDDNCLDSYVNNSASFNLIGLKIFSHDTVSDMKTIKIQNNINITNNTGRNVDRDVAILSNNYSNCSLLLDNDMQHVKVDDMTPVVCTEVNYTPMSEKITFAGIKMIPVPPKFVDVIISFPSQVATAIPSFAMFQKVKADFESFDKIDSKLKKKIIAKMQKAIKVDKKEVKNSVNIMKIFEMKNVEYIKLSRSASMEYASMQVIANPANITDEEKNDILDGDIVLTQLFHDIAHEMKTVIDLIKSGIPDKSKYWSIYAKYRF